VFEGEGGVDVIFIGWGGGLYFNIDELSLTFILLVCFLYPVILFIMDLEVSIQYYKYLIYLLWLYFCIFIFLFTCDLLVFFISYELMI